MSQKFMFIDLEFQFDEDLHQAHQQIDPRSDRHAIATRRVIAASAWTMTLDDEGRISSEGLYTWTSDAQGSERAVVSELFDHMRRHERHSAITYGGMAVDVPVLKLAAMQYGLRLPPQLLGDGTRWTKEHLDLGLLLKAKGKTWTHLAQLLLRLEVPVSLVAGKPHVRVPDDPRAWQDIRDHVALDAMLLALAWLAWQISQGAPALRFAPAAVAVLNAFLRQRPHHPLTKDIERYAQRLTAELAAGCSLAA